MVSRDYKVPELFYNYEGKTIWGLTAQIIDHIITALQSEKAEQK